MVVAIPSKREAPPAIRYMLSLGDKRLSNAELDAVEVQIKHCREVNNNCQLCPYAEQCARLFDIRVDRGKWE